MKLNFIAGLPRSGSTLLCNVLNQNPNFFASSTSCLPLIMRGISATVSDSFEFKNLLNLNSDQTNQRLQGAMRGFCENWYAHAEKDVVFDKSRAWTGVPFLTRDLAPEGKMIVCVRDLRDVFASCVKQSRKNGLYGHTMGVDAHFKDAFDANGIIGAPYLAVLNLLAMKDQLKNIIFLKYEFFVQNPRATIERVYNELDLPYFDHDFEDVVNTAIDPDGFYLNQFPHKGEGKVEPLISTWKNVIPEYIANDIMRNSAGYNNAFQYQ
jgi:sulfotransferase